MKFTDILIQHNVPHWTEGKYCRTGWIQFDCPFCSGGKDPNKPYGGFNIASSYIHCWRCGPHNLTKTVSLLCNLDWMAAKALVGDLEIPRGEVVEHTGRLILPKGLGELLKCHRKYLRGRGFNVDELERLWRVQGIGLASQLAWRIWIPIHFHGQVVSWTTRSLLDEGIRYVSASAEQESVPHKSLLYGEDAATNVIIVCEGPFDVWAIGPGAVATLGTSTTPAQILRMSRYARRVICYDAEKPAQSRAARLCDMLAGFPGETFNVTLNAKDPGSASERELAKLRKFLK